MTDTNVATIQKHPIVVMRERFVARRDELKAALPSDIDPDHFIRALTTSAQINADLQACSFQSLWLAAMRACRDGLLPDGVEGAIVPYKTSATWIPMYRGLLKKFRQSGQCKWVGADVVRTGETFEHYVDETGEHFRHVPGEAEGKVEKVYAAALTKDGAFYVAVLSMKDIDKIKAMSRASREDAPWKMWPEEMQKKSALRRLSKLLPSGRDIVDEDDFLPGFPALPDSPPLQPLAPPSDEPRRPQSAAASLDSFAGSSTAASSDGEHPHAASEGQHGGDGEGVTSATVAATNTETTADDTLNYMAEADGDPIKAAYQAGQRAKRDGFARKAIPGEYRGAEHSREMTAWQCGYDGKDMPTWSD